MPADIETTRKAVEDYFEAIQQVNAKGIEEALAFMSEDVLWENPYAIKQGGRFVGKQAVRDLLTTAIAEVYVPNSMKQFGRKTICEGNRAVCVFDTTAMTKRGREYRQHFAIEFEVNDEGKLSFIRENFDTLLFHNIVYGD